MSESQTYNQFAWSGSTQEYPTVAAWGQTQLPPQSQDLEAPTQPMRWSEQLQALVSFDLENVDDADPEPAVVQHKLEDGDNMSHPVRAEWSMNENHQDTDYSWPGSQSGPTPSIIISKAQEPSPGNDTNFTPPSSFNTDTYFGGSYIGPNGSFVDEAPARLPHSADLHGMCGGTTEIASGSNMASMEQQSFNTDGWDPMAFNHDQPFDQTSLVGQNDLEWGSAIPWNTFVLRGTEPSENPYHSFYEHGIPSHATSIDTPNRSGYPSRGILTGSGNILRPSLTSDNLMRSSDLAHSRGHVSPSNLLSTAAYQQHASGSTKEDGRPRDGIGRETVFRQNLEVPEDDVSVVSSVTPSHVPDTLHCPTCGKSYTGRYRRGTLQRHVRLKHGRVPGRSERDYPCHVNGCSEVYQRQDALLKHQRRRHPELNLAGPISRPRSRHRGSGASAAQRSGFQEEPGQF